MGLKLLLLSLLLCFSALTPSANGNDEEHVTVTVKGVLSVGSTDENFICATMDWWPPNKCDYNQCPWGLASVLNLDLSNPVLPKALKAFGDLRIRVGGSLQDQVTYKVGSVKSCPGFKKKKDGMFGFSTGCLHMDRWDQVYDLFNKSSVKVTFGLNALVGREKVNNESNALWGGAWDPSNARDFIDYTISKGQVIDSWELGNELCGEGVSARVEGKQYGQDMIVLRSLIDQLYANSTKLPKVLAPGGFWDEKWFDEFLQVAGPNVVDGITHHFYNLGSGADPNLLSKMQDPYVLDNVLETLNQVKLTLRSYAPWTDAWVGEAGGAYNSGGKNVSHSFVNSFWYLDQLGQASSFDHKVYCRQSLIGGNYGLLNTTTMVPNPDYYSALLWHRLMGTRVLSTVHGGSPNLRTYTHCSKNETGITMLFINLSNSTTFKVNINEDLNIYPATVGFQIAGTEQREEYHLTAKDGDIQSHTMELNGVPLELTDSGEIPPLNPIYVGASSPINIDPSTIAFIRVMDFRAPACESAQ
ncbi:heparanase-like protein 2 [Aristolochia californica]|uniref:heparanase-like protein 2 n=1 Tax=Aristolochia californica TaxID=171875 RepID=UPI0035DF566E